MNEAKALRHVELLARIVVTYENRVEGVMGDDISRWASGRVERLAIVLRDLRLALVELDLARSENLQPAETQ